MRSVVSVFSGLDIPYFLTDGSLLHLQRNCSLGEGDLDFVIQLHWWDSHSGGRLQEALEDKGFQRTIVFGEVGSVGYQESWTRDQIKVSRYINLILANSPTAG